MDHIEIQKEEEQRAKSTVPVGDVPSENAHVPPVAASKREDQVRPSIVSLDEVANKPLNTKFSENYGFIYWRLKIIQIAFFCSLFIVAVTSFNILFGHSANAWLVAVFGGGLIWAELSLRKRQLVPADCLSAIWYWQRKEGKRICGGDNYSIVGTVETIGGGFQYSSGYIAGSMKILQLDGTPVHLKNVMVPSLLESFVRSGKSGRFFIRRARAGRCIIFAVENDGTVHEACKQAREVCIEVQSEELKNPDSPIRRSMRSPAMIILLPVFPLMFYIPYQVKYGGAPDVAGLRNYLKQVMA